MGHPSPETCPSFPDPVLHNFLSLLRPTPMFPSLLGTKMSGTNQDPKWCCPAHSWELYDKGNEWFVVYLICFLLKEVWDAMRDSRRVSALPHLCSPPPQDTEQNYHLKNKPRNCALLLFFSLKCFICWERE